MPYDGPPSTVQENNEDGTECDDLQVLDHTSDVQVESNMDEVAGNCPDASNMFHVFIHCSLFQSITD